MGARSDFMQSFCNSVDAQVPVQMVRAMRNMRSAGYDAARATHEIKCNLDRVRPPADLLVEQVSIEVEGTVPLCAAPPKLLKQCRPRPAPRTSICNDRRIEPC